MSKKKKKKVTQQPVIVSQVEALDLENLPAGVSKKDFITMMVSEHEEKLHAELGAATKEHAAITKVVHSGHNKLNDMIKKFVEDIGVPAEAIAALKTLKQLIGLRSGKNIKATLQDWDERRFTIKYSFYSEPGHWYGDNRTIAMPDNIKAMCQAHNANEKKRDAKAKQVGELTTAVGQIERNQRKFIAMVTKMALGQGKFGRSILDRASAALAK